MKNFYKKLLGASCLLLCGATMLVAASQKAVAEASTGSGSGSVLQAITFNDDGFLHTGYFAAIDRTSAMEFVINPALDTGIGISDSNVDFIGNSTVRGVITITAATSQNVTLTVSNGSISGDMLTLTPASTFTPYVTTAGISVQSYPTDSVTGEATYYIGGKIVLEPLAAISNMEILTMGYDITATYN
mgnify:FL=1